MVILLIVVLAAKSTHAHDPLQMTCIGDDNLYFDHRCYTLSIKALTFFHSSDHCMTLGGATRSHMAYITSSALVQKITEKWPQLFPEQDQVTQNGGLRIGAAVRDKTKTYPANSAAVLHDVMWFRRFGHGNTLRETVPANETYLMQIPHSALDTLDDTTNACILLVRSESSPQYKRIDAPCGRSSPAVLCQRDNLNRRFKKMAEGKSLLNYYQNRQVDSYHVCIERSSIDVMCQAINVRKMVNFVQCGLSATKMADNGIIDDPGFIIWETA